MSFNSREYEFADLTLILGGESITKFRAVEYIEKIEREPLYAKGREPHSIQSGNKSYGGKIGLTQMGYQKLVKAGNGSVLNLNLDATIGYGNPSQGDALITDQIIGIRFTEGGKSLKQGDKFAEIELPFIALRIENDNE